MGCYAPLILLNVLGIWIHNWTMWTNNLIVMAVLIVMAYFVERAKNPVRVYALVIGSMLSLMAVQLVLTVPSQDWKLYWVIPYYLVASVFVCHKMYCYLTYSKTS